MAVRISATYHCPHVDRRWCPNTPARTIFTLINRISVFDEKIIANYTEINKLFAFIKLNIKPIKTNFEDCYLCKRKEYFEKIMKTSSLVFVKSQFKNRAKVLREKKAIEVEYSNKNEDKAVPNLKNYIKMHAVDFISNNIKGFSNFVDEYQKFKIDIEEYFNNIYIGEKSLSENELKAVKKIIEFEAKIAFIKALSFPKLVFFENLRKKVSVYIIQEINNLVRVSTIENKKEDNYKNKEVVISEILDSTDYKALDNIDGLENIVAYYKKEQKTNIDNLNFLLVTAGYLNINVILQLEIIEFYFRLSLYVKDKKYSHILLHKYPIAVKMITSYSESKSRKFHVEMRKFIGVDGSLLEYNKKFSLIFALLLENTKYLESDAKYLKFLQILPEQKDDFEKKRLEERISFLKKSIINWFPSNSYANGKVSFFININKSLENIKLINLFNNFEELKDESLIEYILYSGATRDISYKEGIRLSRACQFSDNIWCNYYDEKNAITYIRITETIGNSYKFFPVGVLVIHHNKGINNHIGLSRNLLMVQNEIIDFLKNKIKIEVLIEKRIANIKRKKVEGELGTLLDSLKDISHTYKDHINIKEKIEILENNGMQPSDILDLVKEFTSGLSYIFKIGSFGLESNAVAKDIIDVKNLFDPKYSFMKLLDKFVKSVPYLLKDAKNISFSFDLSKAQQSFKITIDSERNFEAIIFELFFNAIKQNKKENREIKFKIAIEDENLYIANDGLPVPEDKKDTIWDNGITFYANNIEKSAGQGMGLPKVKSYLNDLDLQIELYEGNNKMLQDYSVVFRIYKG